LRIGLITRPFLKSFRRFAAADVADVADVADGA
jgi:hypothetical protein